MAGCCCHTNTASLHEWTFQPRFPAEPSVTSDWAIFPRYCPMISSSSRSFLDFRRCLSSLTACQWSSQPHWIAICYFVFLWGISQLNEVRSWTEMSKLSLCGAQTAGFCPAGLQSPIIAIEPHSAAVRVGESASFRCRVYSGAQPVRLEWKLASNQPLPGNNHTHTHTHWGVKLLNEFWF